MGKLWVRCVDTADFLLGPLGLTCLVSRLLLCPRVIATRTCVLGQWLMDARGGKGTFLCCLLLQWKHVVTLTSLSLPRSDPVVYFPVASTSSSWCHHHEVGLVAGEVVSLPRVQAGIHLVLVGCILLPSACRSPRLDLAFAVGCLISAFMESVSPAFPARLLGTERVMTYAFYH